MRKFLAFVALFVSSVCWGANVTTLPAGATLNSGQWISSPAGHHILQMQSDGNLVLYRFEFPSQYTALWQTFTYNHPGARLVMQADGNLVVYDTTNAPLWYSNTADNAPGNKAYLSLQDDANLVIYFRTYIWSSGTNQPEGSFSRTNSTSGIVLPPTNLVQGDHIVSGNGLFDATLQTDGNFVIYRKDGNSQQALWATHTNGRGVRAAVQKDGNFVIYDAANVAAWASAWGNTYGGLAPFIWMQDDGNLVMFADRPRWATHTTPVDNPPSYISCPPGTVQSADSCVFRCKPSETYDSNKNSCIPNFPVQPFCRWDSFFLTIVCD